MIFRGDGKTNIREGNCFHNHLTRTTEGGVETAEYVKDSENHDPPVTKTLMNPPFSLNDPDEKAHSFVERTLGEMEDGGILFCVIPYATLVKQRRYKTFRENLLKNHTLLSVITFPKDLFYPVGRETAGIIIKKGKSHPEKQNVLWIRALNDGRRKSKNKRLPHSDESNDFERIKPTVKSFIQSPEREIENIPKFQRACPIDFDDTMLELVPEAYLDQEPPTKDELQEEANKIVRETTAFLIKSGREDELKEI